jgi:hypothetical protein
MSEQRILTEKHRLEKEPNGNAITENYINLKKTSPDKLKSRLDNGDWINKFKQRVTETIQTEAQYEKQKAVGGGGINEQSQ